MKYLLVTSVALAVALLAWSLWPSNTAITNYPPPNETIVAFGDSLVEGVGAAPGNDFVSQLARLRDQPIVNLGVAGDTTVDGLARLPEVEQYNPGIVILLLGGNDYLSRDDAVETQANLSQIIQTFQANGAVVVLLGVRGGVLRDNYADMYESLSKTHGTVLVPDVLDGLLANPEYMYDAIHPNDAGYAVIANRIAEEMQRAGL